MSENHPLLKEIPFQEEKSDLLVPEELEDIEEDKKTETRKIRYNFVIFFLDLDAAALESYISITSSTFLAMPSTHLLTRRFLNL